MNGVLKAALIGTPSAAAFGVGAAAFARLADPDAAPPTPQQARRSALLAIPGAAGGGALALQAAASGNGFGRVGSVGVVATGAMIGAAFGASLAHSMRALHA